MTCPVCNDPIPFPNRTACCEAHRRVWARWRRAYARMVAGRAARAKEAA